MLFVPVAYRGHDVHFGGGGRPGGVLRLGRGDWWLVLVGLAGVVGLAGLAGVVFGVGEAGVDGVVQVEALAVPGRDDRAGGDVRVVAAINGAAGGRQGRAGRNARAVRAEKGEGACRACGDEVAAVMDQLVVLRTQADQMAGYDIFRG